jgi:hypothetical protein
VPRAETRYGTSALARGTSPSDQRASSDREKGSEENCSRGAGDEERDVCKDVEVSRDTDSADEKDVEKEESARSIAYSGWASTP